MVANLAVLLMVIVGAADLGLYAFMLFSGLICVWIFD